jgi:5-methyltetrahydrofolate--homocysteine methyltransferase
MAGFLDALQSGRVQLMDGAMGTELRRAGLPQGDCGELWNLTHPARVRAVHRAYAKAGADVLLTNTFQANRPALARHGRTDSGVALRDVIDAAIKAVDPILSDERFALLSVGPIMEPSDPAEFPDPDELIGVKLGGFRFRVKGPRYGLSGILLETCSSPRVVLALRRLTGSYTPVLASLTYRRDAKGKLTTLSGHAPEWFARRAKEWGVAALGVNCGRDIGMDEVIEIVRRYCQETDLPLFARPNAGTPTQRDGRWVYPHSPERMAARVPELIEAGATMIGGCCGTTPKHIAAFRRVIDSLR